MPPLVGAVLKYGMTGIAAWLLWVLTAGILTDVHQNSTDLHTLNALLQQHMVATSRMESQQGVVVNLLRQACVNGAHNYAERNACFVAGSDR